MLQIGWFSTGRDEAAGDLLKVVWHAIDRGEIPDAQIAFVFCNRNYGESAESDRFLNLAKELGIAPLISLSSANFKSDLITPNLKRNFPGKWREEYDRIVMSFLAPYRVDFSLLAGYMRIVSPLMCESYKMINLHPALPDGPKGTWQEVVRQLIEKMEKKSGAMIHLVTPKLDEGHVITFCKYRIKEYDFDKIRQQGLKREFPLIVETLILLAAGKIKIGGRSRDLTKIVDKKI